MSPPIAIPPLPISTPVAQVSDAELGDFAELIYQRTGIHVSPQKKMLLSNRLRRRLRETGIADFAAYYQHLKRLKDTDPEWDAFLQEITTHETYLFRDESQWNWFRSEYLARCAAEPPPQAAKRARGSGRRHAAPATSLTPPPAASRPRCPICALGDSHFGDRYRRRRVAQAEAGVFGERAMRLVPEDYRRRFFTKAPNAQLWQARPPLAAMLKFKQHNLMSPLREKPFDLVFLKNVLIYFDGASKRTVMENVRAMIRPGGLLVAGAAEGITEIVKDFKRLQPWLYRK